MRLKYLPAFAGFIALVSACFGVNTAFTAPAQAAEKIVTLGTAGVTGVYYPAGGAICRLVNRNRKEHGIRCVVESTGGSINNLESIRAGDLELGVVQSDWLYHAYHGSEVFADQGANNKLRVLFALHAEPFTVVARKESNISSFEDLAGKRVNLGSPGSGMRATMEELMRHKGWTEKNFASVKDLKNSEYAGALCGNKIDAVVFAVGHPNGAVQQMTAMCEARLVGVSGPDIDTLIKDNPFYSYTTIPGGMYDGNPDPVRTFGVKAVLVASEDLDPNVVYEIVKAVFENIDNFKTLHPVFATLEPSYMVNAARTVAPLHEGAIRYFRERGLIE